MIEDIQMQSSMLQMEQADLNKEQIESARATVTQIGDVMTEFREARGHIMVNGRLSPEGKQTDLADLQTGTNKKCRRLPTRALSFWMLALQSCNFRPGHSSQIRTLWLNSSASSRCAH